MKLVLVLRADGWSGGVPDIDSGGGDGVDGDCDDISFKLDTCDDGSSDDCGGGGGGGGGRGFEDVSSESGTSGGGGNGGGGGSDDDGESGGVTSNAGGGGGRSDVDGGNSGAGDGGWIEDSDAGYDDSDKEDGGGGWWQVLFEFWRDPILDAEALRGATGGPRFGNCRPRRSTSLSLEQPPPLPPSQCLRVISEVAILEL